MLLAACRPAQLASPRAVTGVPTIPKAVLTMVPLRPSDTPVPPPTPTVPMPTLRPTPTHDLPPNSDACLQEFDRHELREPYDRGEGNERHTLSPQEFAVYLELMGIESLCIPVGFGAPFVNVDWNGFAEPGLAIGRMASLGFERLNDGLTGWSRGYLLYSTYDFQVGTMYQDFAEPEDLVAVRTGSVDNPIQVDGVDGLIRYVPGIPMGVQDITKTYIFPFDDYYIAAVLVLGVYPYEEVDRLMSQIEAGTHPDLLHPYVELMDRMVASIRFR